jgi:TatD DNase family protein
MTGLVDTHCHLMDRRFDADRGSVLRRAREAGVAALVLVGYDLASSRAAVDLARSLPNAVASVGIHPNSSGAASNADFDGLADLARDPTVVAIGETGLDYFRDRTPPQRQRWAFAWHLRLAEALGLPVVVHTRDAHADVASALESSANRRRADQPPGVLHCFTGDRAHALRMVDAGYFVSFAGPLTYKSSNLPGVAAAVPAERLLVETDCPYLPPASHRGERNEPAFVVETARVLAHVRQMTDAALVEQLWSNSVRVFPALARTAQAVV